MTTKPNVMAFRYKVSLQVWHPSAHPSQIAQQIGRNADASHVAGEERRTPTGSRLEGLWRESYALFHLGEREDGELARFLEEAVTELSPVKPVFDDVRTTGGKVVLSVGWWEGARGEAFSPDLLLRIAGLGVDLGIEPIGSR